MPTVTEILQNLDTLLKKLEAAEAKLQEFGTGYTFYNIKDLLYMEGMPEAAEFFTPEEIENIPWLRGICSVVSNQSNVLSNELNEFITAVKLRNNYDKLRLGYLLTEIDEHCLLIEQTAGKIASLTVKVPMEYRANWD